MSTYGPRAFLLKSGDRAVIAHAEPGDATALLAFRLASYRDSEYLCTEPDEFTTTLEAQRELIRQHLSRAGQVSLIARVGGDIVGHLTCDNPDRRRLAHTGTIFMAVAKEWRGNGIGSMLMMAAVEWAESNPVLQRLALAVIDENQHALALYRKLGFNEEGRCLRAIRLAGDRYANDVLMFRFVKPQVQGPN